MHIKEENNSGEIQKYITFCFGNEELTRIELPKDIDDKKLNEIVNRINSF